MLLNLKFSFPVSKGQMTLPKQLNISALLQNSVITLLCLGFYLFVFKLPSFAQIPEPHVPCGAIEDPEFQSLRPYQASPCYPDIYHWSIACGNDIIPIDEIEVTPSDAEACVSNPDGSQYCKFKEDREVTINLAFPDAELPIVGNTQLVPNSQNKGVPAPYPLLDDAQKTNEYVSWYLNGTSYRAEDEPLSYEKALKLFDTNQLTPESHSKVVDYSGPLQKLLPFYLQLKKRVDTIEIAKSEQRHNQIVACTFGKSINVFGIINIGELGGIPIPCYPNSKILGLAGIVLDVVDIGIKEHRLYGAEGFDGHTPPLETEAKYQDRSFQDYWIDYKRWRGQSCVQVPIPFLPGREVLVCYNNPSKPDYWANMFYYIPLSTTEDRKGDVSAGLPVIDPANLLTPPYAISMQPTFEEGNEVKITSIDFTPSERRDLLYFAHMQEVSEQAALLQDTFLPLNGVPSYEGNFEQDDIRPLNFDEAQINDYFVSAYTTYRCDLKDVRWNTGDDLFGEHAADTEDSSGENDPKGPIAGTINYSAEFTCDFGPNVLDQACYDSCIEDGDTQEVCTARCTGTRSCKKKAMTAVSVYTRTPEGESVWERLVSGPGSVFKKIYPKIGVAGMFEEIKDLPGVTSDARYSSSADETLAGDPRSNRPGERAEIFIPHLGGIYEYFLKGIQDALRPKEAKSSFPPGYPPTGGTCQQGTGYCSQEHLLSFFDNNALYAGNASQICQKESGSYPFALNKRCLIGKSYDYSVGLFQINLVPIPRYDANGNLIGLNEGRCPGAFVTDISLVQPPFCIIKDADKLDACVENYFRPEINIQKAYELSNGGATWSGHWKTNANACGIL